MRASLFLETYNQIQRLCDEHDESDVMYAKYQDMLTNYINDRVRPAIENLSSSEYIIEYDKQWRSFTSYCFVLNKLFNYIDRYYLSQSQETELESLFETAREIFKKEIFDKQINKLK